MFLQLGDGTTNISTSQITFTREKQEHVCHFKDRPAGNVEKTRKVGVRNTSRSFGNVVGDAQSCAPQLLGESEQLSIFEGVRQFEKIPADGCTSLPYFKILKSKLFFIHTPLAPRSMLPAPSSLLR